MKMNFGQYSIEELEDVLLLKVMPNDIQLVALSELRLRVFHNQKYWLAATLDKSILLAFKKLKEQGAKEIPNNIFLP